MDEVDERLNPKEEKLIKYLEWHAMDGWHFARTWTLLSSGIMLFFAIILFFAMKDVQFPGWRRDCVRAIGLVGFGFMAVNALVGWDTYKFEKKTQKRRVRNVVQRRFLKGVDDNPNINPPGSRDKANVAFYCDHCDHEYTDPPEILHLHGASGNDYYQVMCPKCWQHTAWYDTPREAEAAWNKKHRWLMEGSWSQNDE